MFNSGFFFSIANPSLHYCVFLLYLYDQKHDLKHNLKCNLKCNLKQTQNPTQLRK